MKWHKYLKLAIIVHGHEVVLSKFNLVDDNQYGYYKDEVKECVKFVLGRIDYLRIKHPNITNERLCDLI